MARITFSLGVHLLCIMQSSTLHLGNLEEVFRSIAVINVQYYYFLCGKINTENSVSFLKRNQPRPIFLSQRQEKSVILPKYIFGYVTRAVYNGAGSVSLCHNCHELKSWNNLAWLHAFSCNFKSADNTFESVSTLLVKDSYKEEISFMDSKHLSRSKTALVGRKYKNYIFHDIKGDFAPKDNSLRNSGQFCFRDICAGLDLVWFQNNFFFTSWLLLTFVTNAHWIQTLSNWKKEAKQSPYLWTRIIWEQVGLGVS